MATSNSTTRRPRRSGSALELCDVNAGYPGSAVLDSLDLTFPAGRITVIIGANGCGKSTLLRTAARLIKPTSGHVLLDGDDVHELRTRTVAQRLALLPQHPLAPEGVLVQDLVARGRFPHRGMFGRSTRQDRDAVEEALLLTDTDGLRNRQLSELSGGQRQRVWIALALAQEPQILLLDEPTTYLDLRHQIEILDVLWQLNRRHGTTLVMVLHDVNLAARYADEIVAMAGGTVTAQGSPESVLTAELVREVLALDAVIAADPVTGRPWVVPRNSNHDRVAAC